MPWNCADVRRNLENVCANYGTQPWLIINGTLVEILDPAEFAQWPKTRIYNGEARAVCGEPYANLSRSFQGSSSQVALETCSNAAKKPENIYTKLRHQAFGALLQDAEETLLAFLRRNGVKSVKLSCNEGGCGACCVLVTTWTALHGVQHKTINACLTPVLSAAGAAVATAEWLSEFNASGTLSLDELRRFHPIQRVLIDAHASQCGFCTPGIVMALYGKWLQCEQRATSQTAAKSGEWPRVFFPQDIEDALDGNLCRCTGYRPILDALQLLTRHSETGPDECGIERSEFAPTNVNDNDGLASPRSSRSRGSGYARDIPSESDETQSISQRKIVRASETITRFFRRFSFDAKPPADQSGLKRAATQEVFAPETLSPRTASVSSKNSVPPYSMRLCPGFGDAGPRIFALRFRQRPKISAPNATLRGEGVPVITDPSFTGAKKEAPINRAFLQSRKTLQLTKEMYHATLQWLVEHQEHQKTVELCLRILLTSRNITYHRRRDRTIKYEFSDDQTNQFETNGPRPEELKSFHVYLKHFGDEVTWISPATLKDLVTILRLLTLQRRRFRIFQGNTERHIERFFKRWKHQYPLHLLFLGNINSLNSVQWTADGVLIGGTTPLTDILEAFKTKLSFLKQQKVDTSCNSGRLSHAVIENSHSNERGNTQLSQPKEANSLDASVNVIASEDAAASISTGSPQSEHETMQCNAPNRPNGYYVRKLDVRRLASIVNVLEAYCAQIQYFAGTHVRNVAGLGGNIATASPISDLNPLHMAVDATLYIAWADISIVDGPATATIDVRYRKQKIADDFFLSYRKVNLEEYEVVTHIYIPFFLDSAEPDVALDDLQNVSIHAQDGTSDFSIVVPECTPSRIETDYVGQHRCKMQPENVAGSPGKSRATDAKQLSFERERNDKEDEEKTESAVGDLMKSKESQTGKRGTNMEKLEIDGGKSDFKRDFVPRPSSKSTSSSLSTLVCASSFSLKIEESPVRFVYGFKQCRRREDDIAIVNCAVAATLLNDGTVLEMRIFFGGMAPTPKRAVLLEKFWFCRKFDFENFALSLQALIDDTALLPNTPGGMVSYRVQLAQSFYFKAFFQIMISFYSLSRRSTGLTQLNLSKYNVFALSAIQKVLCTSLPSSKATYATGTPQNYSKQINAIDSPSSTALLWRFLCVTGVTNFPFCIPSHITFQHKAHCKKGLQHYGKDARKILPSASHGLPMRHTAGHLHVAGTSEYLDDAHLESNEVYGFLFTSTVCSGKIVERDYSGCATVEQFLQVIDYRDQRYPRMLIGGGAFYDEEVFASDKVFCVGQPLGIVLALTAEAAREAAARIIIKYEKLDSVLTISEAITCKSYFEVDFDGSKELEITSVGRCTRTTMAKSQSCRDLVFDKPANLDEHFNQIWQDLEFDSEIGKSFPFPGWQLVKKEVPTSYSTTVFDITDTAAAAVNRSYRCGDHIVVQGMTEIGAQEHFYFEPHGARVILGEENRLRVISSTQDPAKSQSLVAQVTGVPKHKIICSCKRMGGGFGGKESRAAFFAAYTAVAAVASGRSVRLIVDRDVDFQVSGQRHPFRIYYRAAIEKESKLFYAAEVLLYANAGWSTDLSVPVLERSVFHAENAYLIPNFRVIGRVCKTNLPSNTAFRGFGAPQAMFAAETIVEHSAAILNCSAEIIRQINLYRKGDCTHYNYPIVEDQLHTLWQKIFRSANVETRRAEVEEWNASSQAAWQARGIAVVPVKFGMSFTKAFMNQAGSLVHVYADGTVLVSHTGTEMGQGLYTKMAQVAASAFDIPLKLVHIEDTSTDKVPNGMPTAASSGSDLAGMAVLNACDQIVSRLKQYLQKERLAHGMILLPSKRLVSVNTLYVLAAKHSIDPAALIQAIYDLPLDETLVRDHLMGDPVKTPPVEYNNILQELAENAESDTDDLRCKIFAKAARAAHFDRVNLSANGFYAHPNINYVFNTNTGRPFHYLAYGVACSEVVIDGLTGDHRVLRADIIQDVGTSLNPAIDIGQVEGAFVQGQGLFTLEEMVLTSEGAFFSRGPGAYKIPSADDIPVDFRVTLLENTRNRAQPAVHSSKGVGEPPLFLASSIFFAIRNALEALRRTARIRQYKILRELSPNSLFHDAETSPISLFNEENVLAQILKKTNGREWFTFTSPATAERICLRAMDFANGAAN